MAPSPPITREQLRALALHRTATPLTSCYLDVDGRRFGRPQDLQRSVDQLLRRGREAAAGDPSRLADLDRIGAFVRQGLDRSQTRGLAIFSHHDEGFWHVVALPCPVPNHVVGGLAPLVAPLEVALADHEPIGVLLVDRAKVRVLVFSWDELVEYAEANALAVPESAEGDRARVAGTAETRAEEQQARQARHAARSCFDVHASNGFERLVIGGPEPLVVEVERVLHPYLRKIYHGRIAPHPGASLEEIGRAVRAAEAEIARTREAALVEQLRHSVALPAGPGTNRSGPGRAGLEDVLAALASHRVERILVSDGFAEPGWRCAGCGRLALVGPGCPDCGATMAKLDDVVSEAVDQAIAERARVDVCVDCADLDVLGRIGALLRY